MTTRRSPDEWADDYALGLLEPAERDALEARLADEPELRKAVGRSRDRFLDLDAASEPLIPASSLWQAISARLEDDPETVEPPEAPTAPRAAAVNDNDRSRFWRRSAFGAMAASLVLAAALGWSLAVVEPRIVAVLLDEEGAPLALVEDFADTTARVTLLTDFAVPDGRTMQVWTLPSPELGPVSLGLLPEGETRLLQGPNLPAPRTDQLYEITVEAAGGSATGRPTGPILVKGYGRAPR